MIHSTIRRFSRVALALALLGVVGIASGCAILSPYPPSYVEKRKANLDAAVAEFDASSVAPIVCDWAGGYVGLNNGYTHDYIFSGSESVNAVVDRLNSSGYWGGGIYIENLRFGGGASGSVKVSGTVVFQDDEKVPAFTEQLADHKCIIPSAGAVLVHFQEG